MLRHEIMKLKAGHFDHESRLRAVEQMLDLLIEEEEDTAEELAEHEIEDEMEHEVLEELIAHDE